MSLPKDFSDPAAYFQAAIGFLEKYAWIYKYANTCFLKQGTLDQMPSEFKHYFLHISNRELNTFPLLQRPLNFDARYIEVQKFREDLTKLIPNEAFAVPACEELPIPTKVKAFQKMNPKKRHEIARLACLITKLQEGSEVFVDFGSGLGYLSEMLHYSNKPRKVTILGLESDQYRVQAAQKRQQEYMPDSIQHILYKTEYISMDSATEIQENFQQLASRNQIANPEMCIIGLHSCADLTITSIKLFLTMERITKLVIMPCCYHKMACSPIKNKEPSSGSEDLVFENFPLSSCLKVALDFNYQNQDYAKILNRPFLRLACQQTSARWSETTKEEHMLHGSEMFWRALAECLTEDEEIVCKKSRKVQVPAEGFKTFKEFMEYFTLKCKRSGLNLEWRDSHKQKFDQLCSQHCSTGGFLAEGLTCLQTAIQKLCENLVLYDRLCYLREYADTVGISLDVRYEKLLNEQLSPRCYVLTAIKL